MAFVKVEFKAPGEQVKDILIAVLDGIGFTGFEEDDNVLHAYIDSEQLDEETLKGISAQYGIEYNKEIIADKNWNEEWEKDFQPVVVGSFCTVRAHFHIMPVNTLHEIIITPKMSFGTGHHATTQLMIEHMGKLDFDGRKVLDFGTGTGVLAILAEKLRATSVTAIDNDEWSVENTNENIERNNCKSIAASLGSLDDITGAERYDVILANINRNILLTYMQQMYQLLVTNGILMMSGLLKEDKEVIMNAAMATGLKWRSGAELNNWITLSFEK